MKRNDIHCPSRFVPSDYAYVLTFAYAGMDGDPSVNLDRLVELRRTVPFFSKPSGSGGCDICGAHFRYGSVFVHVPTGEHITVGWECAEKVEGCASMTSDRSMVMTTLERLRVRAERRWKLRMWIKDADLALRKAFRCQHHIVRDIRSRLIRNGYVSDAQTALVLKLAKEEQERSIVPAEVKVPAPEGRMTVEGEVLSVKTHDSFYGSSLKVTVKVQATDGSGIWLAWGTLPSGLKDVHRGDVIRFDGTVTRSYRDVSFAFFKRPTKGAKVQVRETSDV